MIKSKVTILLMLFYIWIKIFRGMVNFWVNFLAAVSFNLFNWTFVHLDTIKVRLITVKVILFCTSLCWWIFKLSHSKSLLRPWPMCPFILQHEVSFRSFLTRGAFWFFLHDFFRYPRVIFIFMQEIKWAGREHQVKWFTFGLHRATTLT